MEIKPFADTGVVAIAACMGNLAVSKERHSSTRCL